jgi:hypothetical protein
LHRRRTGKTIELVAVDINPKRLPPTMPVRTSEKDLMIIQVANDKVVFVKLGQNSVYLSEEGTNSLGNNSCLLPIART